MMVSSLIAQHVMPQPLVTLAAQTAFTCDNAGVTVRSLCLRVPRLVQDLAIARGDGTYRSELQRLARFDVIVLDDFLIGPMKDVERRDLLEVLEDRYDRSSTVITSQLPTKAWHDTLADPTIADAICDRLVHNAHLVALRGPRCGRRKESVPRPPETNQTIHSSLSLQSCAHEDWNGCPSRSGMSAQVGRNTQPKTQTSLHDPHPPSQMVAWSGQTNPEGQHVELHSHDEHAGSYVGWSV